MVRNLFKDNKGCRRYYRDSSLVNIQILLDHGAHVNPIMRNSRGQLMTPLDAALYQGFRGCAKFIQLHGGVPACKIADGEALQDAMSR